MHDAILAAESAIIDALPPIIARHRDVGHLTWKVLHQIEEEVMAAVAAEGRHSPSLLRMLKASPLMDYPKDDSVASLSEHGACPVAFNAIFDAWYKVH